MVTAIQRMSCINKLLALVQITVGWLESDPMIHPRPIFA
jgi:hypothetical protein